MTVTLSIITPNYNDGELLAQRLALLLPQLPKDVEYLICDDASTDDSLQKIQAAIGGHSSVRLIENEKNLGVIPTCNRIATLARGNYLYFSSANDLVYTEELLSTLKYLRTLDAGVLLTDCHYQFVDKKRADTHQVMIEECKDNTFLDPEQIVKKMRTTSLWIPSHCAIFRRDIFVKYGFYLTDLRHHCDFFLNQIAALEGGVCYIPKLTFSSFLASSGSYSDQCSFWEEVQLANRFLCVLEKLEPKMRSRAYRAGVFSHAVKKALFVMIIKPKYWPLLLNIIVRKCNLALAKIQKKRQGIGGECKEY